ncbi:FecR domain-containing protein [Verrucomicrobiaceae bacterium N1E253]|uniref:FecR domain-containing protein n=1 Tax=Oceaniferula marina TaxID=2748318 RepID=A0A851GJY1_9BACT|nr:LamG-like jellyroll fold domain-containing protein [Oceaniferula marina]NWK55010.1 FecR domain-containing protein [Oceaniferula marina]
MNPEDLNAHIQDLLDGDIEPDALAQLEQELATNPEAMQQYIAYTDLNNLLDLEHEVRAKQSSGVVPIERIMHRQKLRNLRSATLSAAAILVIVVVAMSLFFSKEKAPILTFQSAPGTLFTLSHDKHGEQPAGQLLEPGSRLQISQGTVELTFRSGVRSIIQAPADLTLHDDNHLYLAKGIAWFHVAKGAEGFTVDTADLQVVDLGTEFGVHAHPNQHDEVHVFQGKVRVSTKRIRQESTTLISGEARRATPIGQLNSIPSKPDEFLSSLPSSLPHLHWSFDNAQELKPARVNYAGPEIQTSIIEPENQHHTTISPTQGVRNSALHSLGQGGKIISDWSGIRANQARTISFWIKIDSKAPRQEGNILGWGDRQIDHETTPWRASTASFYSFLSIEENRTRVGLSAGRFWITGTQSIADSQWHHIVCIYDGTADSKGNPNLQLYIDGQPEQVTKHRNTGLKVDDKRGIKLNTRVDSLDSVPLSIFADLWGKDESGNNVNAAIDELFIIRGAVSEDQIFQLYRNNQLENTSSQ